LVFFNSRSPSPRYRDGRGPGPPPNRRSRSAPRHKGPGFSGLFGISPSQPNPRNHQGPYYGQQPQPRYGDYPDGPNRYERQFQSLPRRRIKSKPGIIGMFDMTPKYARNAPSEAYSQQGTMSRNGPPNAYSQQGTMSRNGPPNAYSQQGTMSRNGPPDAYSQQGTMPRKPGSFGVLFQPGRRSSRSTMLTSTSFAAPNMRPAWTPKLSHSRSTPGLTGSSHSLARSARGSRDSLHMEKIESIHNEPDRSLQSSGGRQTGRQTGRYKRQQTPQNTVGRPDPLLMAGSPRGGQNASPGASGPMSPAAKSAMQDLFLSSLQRPPSSKAGATAAADSAAALRRADSEKGSLSGEKFISHSSQEIVQLHI